MDEEEGQKMDGSPKSKSTTTQLEISTNLQQYFTKEISATADRQGATLSPLISEYLAQVLTRFSMSENYLEITKNSPDDKRRDKHRDYPTLALMWLESIGLDTFTQLNKLQRLGDIALFTSGFLGGRIKRSLVDRDYFMAMGERAYEKAGLITTGVLKQDRDMNIFFELSQRFPALVEVFAELADQSMLATDSDILKLYSRWMESQSERLGRMLSEVGITLGRNQS